MTSFSKEDELHQLIGGGENHIHLPAPAPLLGMQGRLNRTLPESRAQMHTPWPTLASSSLRPTTPHLDPPFPV
eukprot:scaffold81732_cov45-Tisochrysis_lutea.AAC.1